MKKWSMQKGSRHVQATNEKQAPAPGPSLDAQPPALPKIKQPDANEFNLLEENITKI